MIRPNMVRDFSRRFYLIGDFHFLSPCMQSKMHFASLSPVNQMR